MTIQSVSAHTLLMESQVKFYSKQNISGASWQTCQMFELQFYIKSYITSHIWFPWIYILF